MCGQSVLDYQSNVGAEQERVQSLLKAVDGERYIVSGLEFRELSGKPAVIGLLASGGEVELSAPADPAQLTEKAARGFVNAVSDVLEISRMIGGDTLTVNAAITPSRDGVSVEPYFPEDHTADA